MKIPHVRSEKLKRGQRSKRVRLCKLCGKRWVKMDGAKHSGHAKCFWPTERCVDLARDNMGDATILQLAKKLKITPSLAYQLIRRGREALAWQ